MGLGMVKEEGITIVDMKDMQDGEFGIVLLTNDIVYCHKPLKELFSEIRHHYIVNLTRASAGMSWSGSGGTKVMLLPKGTTFKLN